MKTFQKMLSRGLALVMAFNLVGSTAFALAAELATPVITKPAQNEVLKNFPRTVHLEWTSVASATSYNVNMTCAPAQICVVGSAGKPYVTSTEKNYLDITVTGDDQYSFTVQPAAGSAVGNWSDTRNFSFNTTPVKVGKVFATGKFEGGYAKIDWEPAAGLGTTFDKYNVRYKKGSWGWIGAEAEGVRNAYVGFDYYNLGLSETGTWSFMVMPVKLVDGKYVEVGEYANTTTVTIPEPAPTSVGKVFATGKIENWTEIKLDWEPLPGLGSTFDKYNVRSKKADGGAFEMDSIGVENAYIGWDYYNTTRAPGTWQFKIVPVKWIDGKYKEVGEAGNVVTMITSSPETKTDCQLNPPKLTTLYEYGQNFPLNGSQVLTFDLSKGNNITHYWSTCKEATKYELQYSSNNFASSHKVVWEGTYNNVGIAGMVLGKHVEELMNDNGVGGGKIAIRISAKTEKGTIDGPALNFDAEVIQKAAPTEPTYKGANGQTYVENDFKFTDNVWKIDVNNYAKIGWNAPSGKYIDGYAVYAISGQAGFSNGLSGQTPVYVGKYTTSYTFPQYFSENGTVTFKVYPYIQLMGGAKKFLQGGYDYLTVQVKPAQATTAKIQNVMLDYRYFRNGIHNKPEVGSIIVKVQGNNQENQAGYNFNESKYASYGGGAFYINNTEGGGKFYGNNVGQGGVIPMGNVAISDVKPSMDTTQYQRFGVNIYMNHTYAIYDKKNEAFALVRVTGSSGEPLLAAPGESTNPPATNTDADSISLSVVSWTGPVPLLQWTPYNDKYFDGYAMFVRQGTWDKNKVTWVDPSYFEKTKTSHQISKVFTDTTYTVRIIPYVQKSSGKEFIYPASNIIVFTTGKENATQPVNPVNKYCGNGKGNAAGNDGSYDVCVGDSIEHEDTFVTVKVLKITSKQVKLKIEGADKEIVVLKNASKGGKSKTFKTDADMLITIKFTGISGSSGGAMIQLSSQEIN